MATDDKTTMSVYQKWYQSNGEKLNESRRQRYALDQAYRKRVLKLNEKTREKLRLEKAEEEAKMLEAQRFRPMPKTWKVIQAEVQLQDGSVEVRPMLTIGALAKVCGRSVKAVRLWEAKGLIPETPYRSKKGDRLYTPDMVMKIHEVLEQAGLTSDAGPQPRQKSQYYIVHRDDGVAERILLSSIGELARLCRRSIATLEQLEVRGVLPKTPFRAPNTGYRLYSIPMINAAKEAFEWFDARPNSDWAGLASRIETGWKKAGHLNAKFDPYS